MKKCTRCKELKNESEFGKWKRGKDGLKTWCRECVKSATTLYNRKHGIIPHKDILKRQDGKKHCFCCKKWLNESEFGSNKNRIDKLCPYCKKCANTKSRKWFEKNKIKRNQQKREYKKTFLGKYTQYKFDAKYHNRKFELSEIDFGYLVSSPCHYCGKIQGNLNGVDRIDSSKGYIEGNCVPCCTSCNTAKMTESEKEFNENTSKRFDYSLCKFFDTYRRYKYE